ncbi:MAG: hypothetical protein WDN27_04420 [Candidatus Saccharibacteria bacterium]
MPPNITATLKAIQNPNMDDQKQQLIDRIKQAQNILVTVSTNPSVDQLAAAIGLTLALNKLDKHGTAVFSGQVPSTIEFLKPEDTLEKNTDSLRDFIIALDKSKADKLRYKVEDQVVRIFITPYKTSLSEQDLNFSQGDFNVDIVVALGVSEQQDLDAAITAHGRILHDATVASVSTTGKGSLGTINWIDTSASSLSEMVAGLASGLDKKVIDGQIATALLTGIVASTDRFSNEKTSPRTMSASAELMAAGANQQLISTELETAPPAPVPAAVPQATSDTAAANFAGDQPAPPAPEPGTLEIDHPEEPEPAEPAPTPEPQIHVDEDGVLLPAPPPLPEISNVHGIGENAGQTGDQGHTEVSHGRMTEPPQLGDADLTANIMPEQLDPSTEELSLPPLNGPLLSHNESVLPPDAGLTPPAAAAPDPFIPQPPLQPAPTGWQPPQTSPPAAPLTDDTTLTEIEASVDSPHLHPGADTPAPAGDTIDSARDAVEAAYNHASPADDPLQPIAALNAQPLGPDLHGPVPQAQPAPSFPAAPVPNPGFSEPTPGTTPADDALDMPLPSNPFGPSAPAAQPGPSTPAGFGPQPASPSAFPGAPQPGSAAAPGGQTPPPPVPPPMLPPLQ